MNNKKIYFLGVSLLFFPGVAMAYVDPGTGAYLLQLLVTIFGAVIFYISKPAYLFRLIKDFFARKKKNDESS